MPRRKQLALKHCASCLFAARSVASACVRRATGSTHTHTKRFSHRRRRQSRDDSGRPALIGKLTDGLALRIFGGNVCAGHRPPCDLQQLLDAGVCPHRLGKLLQLLRHGREEWQRCIATKQQVMQRRVSLHLLYSSRARSGSSVAHVGSSAPMSLPQSSDSSSCGA